MTEHIECPICWELIEMNVNYLKTQCGHQFHANCFMTHTSHNWYSCPCCRQQLIVNPISNADDDEDHDSETLGSQDTRDYNFGGIYILQEDEIMFSFRWFYQRLNDEELEEDQYNLSSIDGYFSDEETVYDENKEQVENLTKRLKQINQLPYEKLLGAFMYKNCKDFGYNYYAEELCYNVSHMIDDVHQRLLSES